MSSATLPPPNGLDSSPTIDQLLPALLEVQKAIGPARKTAVNPHLKSRYADLAEIWDCCSGPLHEHGFVVLFPLAGHDLSCLLAHASGQWLRSWIAIPATSRLKGGDGPLPLTPQEFGSALTYYRRYLLSALLAITTEDDDGHTASRRGRETNGHARPQRPPDGSPREDGPKPPPRASWPAVVARIAEAAQTWWENELKIEGVPRERWKKLPNQHEITFHVAKHAVEKGIFTAESVEKRPGVKDPDKVKAAVAALFARAPRRIEAHVMAYLLRCENELRAELGMPERLDGDPAQESEEDVSQDVRGGREPGEEG
jgi:hypothetical protein